MPHLKTTGRDGRRLLQRRNRLSGLGLSRWQPLAIGIEGSPEELPGEQERSKTGARSLAIRSFPHPTGL